MRWERLFGELEGHAEHAHLEERDALVADLAEGEWAARSWLAGLPEAEGLELDVIDVGILSGRVRLANAVLIHLESGSSDHLISTNAVRWVRGGTRATGPAPNSVIAHLGWGPILRELHDDGDTIRLTLVGGAVLEGTIAVAGRDFVRMSSGSGRDRDVPTSALRAVTVLRDL